MVKVCEIISIEISFIYDMYDNSCLMILSYFFKIIFRMSQILSESLRLAESARSRAAELLRHIER